jgi:hypothetical protein
MHPYITVSTHKKLSLNLEMMKIAFPVGQICCCQTWILSLDSAFSVVCRDITQIVFRNRYQPSLRQGDNIMNLKNRTGSSFQLINLIGTIAAGALLSVPALAIGNPQPSPSQTKLDSSQLIASSRSGTSGNSGSSSSGTGGSRSNNGSRSGTSGNSGSSSSGTGGSSSNNGSSNNSSGNSGNSGSSSSGTGGSNSNSSASNSGSNSSSGSNSASASGTSGSSRDAGRGSGSANDGGLYRNSPITPANSNDAITDSFGVRGYDVGNTGSGDSSGFNGSGDSSGSSNR